MPLPPRRAHESPVRECTLGRGLYAIVDVTSLARRGLDPVAFTRAVLVARPAALQIRAKDLAASDVLALLLAVSGMCRDAGVPLVANDHVDLAGLAACAYIHVGQTDLSVPDARRRAPHTRVGVSTHTAEQLAAALEARPDYVAYGPVFATSSKSNPDPCVGLDGLALASVHAARFGVPLVAIGGVTLERAPALRKWATASAAIHALLPPRESSSYAEVTDRAVALHEALLGPGAGAQRPVSSA